MKPSSRNVLLFLALASFQWEAFAQENRPSPKLPQSEVRPAEPQRGNPPRPEAESAKSRDQEPRRPMSPERGRGEPPQGDKRDGGHGQPQNHPDRHREPLMNQDSREHRGSGPQKGTLQHKGPPNAEHPQSGPRDGDHGPRMHHDGQPHQGQPNANRNHETRRQGPQHGRLRGMKHRQRGSQNFGQNRPMPPQFHGQQHPRFQPPQQGRCSMHSRHGRGSREPSMRQGSSPQGNRPRAPMPNHQYRRSGREA